MLAFAAGICMGLLCALLLTWLSLRMEPDGFGILSIAFHLIVLSIVLNWSSLTRGALGIPQLPRAPFPASQTGFGIAVLIIMVLWVIAVYCIDRSSYGRKLAALAEQPWHAAALGVARGRVHLVAFLIAAAASLTDVLIYHQYIGLLHPNDYQFMALTFSIMLVVAGKPGSVLGVTLSTVLLVTFREVLRFFPIPAEILGPLRLILFGLILFVAVWVRRDTLFPKPRSV
jgi:branched-chain amino acid transport system permease protein